MQNFKSGFAAIVGRPNSGKSTLLNALTGEKIAIVSDKPQTTRNKILSIKTNDDYQIVFVDTPGVHKPQTRLGEYMNKVVSNAMSDVDVIILVCECGKDIGPQELKIIEGLRNIPTILALNKADTVTKESLLPEIAKFSELYDFKAIIPISALKNMGVDIVLTEVLKLLPEGPMYYPKEQLTDQPEKQIVAEIIREKLLKLLDKEIPHGTAVEIDSFKNEGEILKIGATIFCEKDSHKAIIIGKNGEAIKRIGSYARQDLEKFFGKKVFLETWVKVREDWRNKDSLLKNFGYNNPN